MIKKLLLGILAVILVAIGVVLVMAAMQDDKMSITRTAEIAAPPEAVFAKVNDFKSWGQWSPWEEMDPNMKREYSANTAGEGATYSWVGNDQVGEGKMTIVESHAPSHVGIRLEFIKPMAATNKTDFSIKPSGNGSSVTWKMEGEKNFRTKIFCVFMDIEKMVGGDFERGLAKLRSVSESAASQ